MEGRSAPSRGGGGRRSWRTGVGPRKYLSTCLGKAAGGPWRKEEPAGGGLEGVGREGREGAKGPRRTFHPRLPLEQLSSKISRENEEIVFYQLCRSHALQHWVKLRPRTNAVINFPPGMTPV